MFRTFMSNCNKEQKTEIVARVDAFSYCGFSVRMTGNIVYHYKSFIGRDFKAWIQMALFIIDPFISREVKKCWLSLAQVVIIIMHEL